MFITAYPDDRRAKEITNSGRAKLLPKPFDVEELLGLIELELSLFEQLIFHSFQMEERFTGTGLGACLNQNLAS